VILVSKSVESVSGGTTMFGPGGNNDGPECGRVVDSG